jgi:hypothetical protein
MESAKSLLIFMGDRLFMGKGNSTQAGAGWVRPSKKIVPLALKNVNTRRWLSGCEPALWQIGANWDKNHNAKLGPEQA